jgi:hypothetical protein
MTEVERGLEQLCTAISATAGRQDLSGIERARSLRSKPTKGGKSLYECLNQLIHYWYCCAAASHLLQLGYTELDMRPTAEESTSNNKNSFDIRACHPTGVRVVGEVFCVSSALWPEKVRKTASKLMKAPSRSRRLIYYNLEAKETYGAERKGLFFLGVAAPKGGVQLVCSTETRFLPGISPNNLPQRSPASRLR